MRNTKQDRWTCQFCKASGWWTPSTHIGLSSLFDHDRPQGGKCRAVEKHCPACRFGNAGCEGLPFHHNGERSCPQCAALYERARKNGMPANGRHG